MKVTYYRLRYTNGSHGAWTTNYEMIVENAKFFKAEIETREFER